MIATRVRWNSTVSTENINNIQDKSQELLGDQWNIYNSQITSATDDDGTLEVIRVWPDLATAEVWINFVNSFDNPPVDAIIITE
jgi:hypothetical protein